MEESNHAAAQRWWRTLPDDVTIAEAQASLDKWCTTRGDARLRRSHVDGRASVLTIAEREPLAPAPATPFPATITEDRVVSAQALVAWRGNSSRTRSPVRRARELAPTAT